MKVDSVLLTLYMLLTRYVDLKWIILHCTCSVCGIINEDKSVLTSVTQLSFQYENSVYKI
jgi:hypothetical protein